MAALRLCEAVLRQGRPLDQAAPDLLRTIPAQADRALALAVTGETLRWLVELDALIDSATRTAPPPDSKVRMVLRLMLAQALRLGTPPHAVIATGLPLLAGGPRRLAHGVFGALVRGQAMLPPAPRLPEATFVRWRAAWGDDVVTAAGLALAAPPPLDLTLADRGAVPQALAALDGVALAPGHYRLPRGHSVEGLPGFGAGGWWVQDLAAALPARLLGEGTGAGVLDLCAAPGGKAMQLASAGWQVTAVDKSGRRLERLVANARRAGIGGDRLAIVRADILDWEPARPADAVLLDAPCSATGTFRRHPDVLHRISDGGIAELAAVQSRLLDRAAMWVRPGGRLVYATCSLEPEEGERQAESFLAAHPGFRIDPVLPDELPDGLVPTGPGWLRTLPGQLAPHGGLDGFFAARFRRAG